MGLVSISCPQFKAIVIVFSPSSAPSVGQSESETEAQKAVSSKQQNLGAKAAGQTEASPPKAVKVTQLFSLKPWWRLKTNWCPYLILKSLNVLEHKGLAVTGSIPALSSSECDCEGALIQDGKAPQCSQVFSKTGWELLVAVTPLWWRGCFSSVWQEGSSRGWSQGWSVLL